MWDQEKDHLKEFQRLLPEYRVRPTALLPLWDVAGFALGNTSFNIHHYCFSAVKKKSQLRDLLEKDPEKFTEILQVIKKFRDDEMEHHDTGLQHDAEKVS